MLPRSAPSAVGALRPSAPALSRQLFCSCWARSAPLRETHDQHCRGLVRRQVRGKAAGRPRQRLDHPEGTPVVATSRPSEPFPQIGLPTVRRTLARSMSSACRRLGPGPPLRVYNGPKCVVDGPVQGRDHAQNRVIRTSGTGRLLRECPCRGLRPAWARRVVLPEDQRNAHLVVFSTGGIEPLSRLVKTLPEEGLDARTRAA